MSHFFPNQGLPSIGPFTNDVWLIILSKLPDRSDLTALRSTCHELEKLTSTLLYSHITLTKGVKSLNDLRSFRESFRWSLASLTYSDTSKSPSSQTYTSRLTLPLQQISESFPNLLTLTSLLRFPAQNLKGGGSNKIILLPNLKTLNCYYTPPIHGFLIKNLGVFNLELTLIYEDVWSVMERDKDFAARKKWEKKIKMDEVLMSKEDEEADDEGENGEVGGGSIATLRNKTTTPTPTPKPKQNRIKFPAPSSPSVSVSDSISISMSTPTPQKSTSTESKPKLKSKPKAKQPQTQSQAQEKILPHPSIIFLTLRQEASAIETSFASMIDTCAVAFPNLERLWLIPTEREVGKIGIDWISNQLYRIAGQGLSGAFTKLEIIHLEYNIRGFPPHTKQSLLLLLSPYSTFAASNLPNLKHITVKMLGKYDDLEWERSLGCAIYRRREGSAIGTGSGSRAKLGLEFGFGEVEGWEDEDDVEEIRPYTMSREIEVLTEKNSVEAWTYNDSESEVYNDTFWGSF